ncbi:MAG: hypothetical protein V1729_01700 [Candidatus Woesearchaeota archaeon]
MGMLDKAKFWKKGSDDLGDFSDLGEFGLDDKPGGSGPDNMSSDLGSDFGDDRGLEQGHSPSLNDDHAMGLQGATPAHREEVRPTQASQDLGDQFGFDPAPSQHSSYDMPRAAPRGQAIRPPAPQYAQQGLDLGDLFKDIEIIHAKLDTIKASLDSVNQRLATLERMAGGDGKSRYTW